MEFQLFSKLVLFYNCAVLQKICRRIAEKTENLQIAKFVKTFLSISLGNCRDRRFQISWEKTYSFFELSKRKFSGQDGETLKKNVENA